MSLAYGVYKVAGSPDAIVPISVDSAGVVQVAGGTGGGSGGTVTVSNFPSVQAVQTPMPSGFIAGQGGVPTAGTAVQVYPAGAVLSNGIIVTASSGNTGTLTVGGSSVNNTVNGSGNGYRLGPGQSVAFAVSNANSVWVNSTVSGDTFDFVGN